MGNATTYSFFKTSITFSSLGSQAVVVTMGEGDDSSDFFKFNFYFILEYITLQCCVSFRGRAK